MSCDVPHRPDDFSPSCDHRPEYPVHSLGKPSVPKLGLSVMESPQQVVRRVWAPQNSGPPSGISDVTTDFGTGLSSEECEKAREANRIASRVAAAVECLAVSRIQKTNVVLACDKFDVLLVGGDSENRLVTIDVTALTNLTIQQRVKLAAAQEMAVEPADIQILDSRGNLLETNCEMYRALADSTLMPLKAVVMPSLSEATDGIANEDTNPISDDSLNLGRTCENDVLIEDSTSWAKHVKTEHRLFALEQRLEASVAQIINEIAQEKRIRQSLFDALSSRVDSIGRMLGDRQDSSPRLVSERTGRPALSSDDTQDPNCSSLTEPPSAVDTPLDPRCAALLSTSWRDFEIAEGTLQHSSDDKALYQVQLRQLNVEKGVIALSRELAHRLCKVEQESGAHHRRAVELESARIADSLRLHSLCDAQSAELQSQCAALKAQAEGLSNAIDGILQWVKEGEPKSFATVVERLTSLGGKLEEASVSKVPRVALAKREEECNADASHRRVQSAAKNVRGSSPRRLSVSPPPPPIGYTSAPVPLSGNMTPPVQTRIQVVSSPVLCDEGMPPGIRRTSSLVAPTSSNASLRAHPGINSGTLRSYSPTPAVRTSTSVSPPSRSSSPQISRSSSPQISSTYGSSQVRSRSLPYYRQNSYVTHITPPMVANSQNDSTVTLNSLHPGIPCISPGYLSLPVQSQCPLSPASSITPSLTNSVVGNGVSIGWTENVARNSMSVSCVMQQSPSQCGTPHGSLQTPLLSPSKNSDVGARSLSPKRAEPSRKSARSLSPKEGCTPSIAPQERVLRPFRRLVSNSIGIGPEC